jgi:ribosomal-protein-alanine N-acetyltransferase
VAAAERDIAPPAITIRPMLPDDVPAVAALERDSYPYPWSEGIFRDCLRVGYLCRTVMLGDELVGYGILSCGAGEAHVLNICVRETLRFRGIGRQLLEYLLNAAVEAGAAEAFLEVRPSNLSAIRLYQSMGFQQIGLRRGYYQAKQGREDAAVFKLQLTDRPDKQIST